MIKQSLIYYLKCIAMSLAFYVLGGAIASFFLTETPNAYVVIFAVILFYSLGTFIRVKLLKRQLVDLDYDFNVSTMLKMCIPTFVMLMLAAILFAVNSSISSENNFMLYAIFEKIKMILLSLYPSGLLVNGIIYNLSDFNNAVYYVMLIVSVLIYAVPMVIGTKKWAKSRNTDKQINTGDVNTGDG